jgi:hypothetical protein
MQEERVTLACAAPTVLVTLANLCAQRASIAWLPGVHIGTGGQHQQPAVFTQYGGSRALRLSTSTALTETGPFLHLV